MLLSDLLKDQSEFAVMGPYFYDLSVSSFELPSHNSGIWSCLFTWMLKICYLVIG